MRLKKFTGVVLATVLSCMMGLTAFAAGSPQVSGIIKDVDTAVDKNGKAIEVKLEEVADKALVENIKKAETFKAILEAANVTVTEGMEVADVLEVKVPEGTEFPATIGFKVPGVTADTKAAVLHYTGTEWEVVKSEVANGEIKATFNSLSPVAFVIDKNTVSTVGSGSTEAPRTGVNGMVPVALVIGAVAVIGFVALGKRKAQ